MTTQQDLVIRNEQALQDLRDKFSRVSQDVTLARFDWRALMESGALASLNISRYRGAKALTAEDLGLDQAEIDQVSSVLDLGQRLLLPKDVLNAFNSVETRARQVLRSYGLLTPIGLFVPAGAYASLAAALEAYQAKFNDLVALLIAGLPQHKLTMQDQYRTLAWQCWQRLLTAGAVGYSDQAKYIDGFVDRCMALFPTEDDLRQSFRFNLHLEFVPMPYQVDQAAPSYAPATDDLLSLRKAVIAEQTAAREKVVGEFFNSVQGELYGLINDALSDALASFQTKDQLQARSVVQLRGLVEKIGQLNFWQDKKLDLIRDEILALLDRPAGARRDSKLDQALLTELADQAKMTTIRLKEQDRGGLVLSASQPAPIVLKPASQPVYQAVASDPALLDAYVKLESDPNLSASERAKLNATIDAAQAKAGAVGYSIGMPDTRSIEQVMQDAVERRASMTPDQQAEQDRKTAEILAKLDPAGLAIVNVQPASKPAGRKFF